MPYTIEEIEYHKVLKTLPDEEDISLHNQNCEPASFTKILYALVPLLEFIGFEITQIGMGSAVTQVPLKETAMNQNGTHQASVFYLLADYTAGLAMFGALPGTYLTGVHDRCSAQPIQLWLKLGYVMHYLPGTGKMIAKTSISESERHKLRSGLCLHGHAELDMTTRIYQDDQLIAKASHVMGVYKDTPRMPGQPANFIQTENAKLSAKLIAGLREDRDSQLIAGHQGQALACRFSTSTPELPSLIRARGLDLSNLISSSNPAFEQVVVLGIGLDPTPNRVASQQQLWYGLDLKPQLKERQKRFDAVGIPPNEHLKLVSSDLRQTNWMDSLLETAFDPGKVTLYVLEGVSMYLTAEELKKLLETVHGFTKNRESRVWLDHVTKRLFSMDNQDVQSFLGGISRLGEPFITGFDTPESLLGEQRWMCARSYSAAEVLGGGNEVHNEYLFSVLRPA